MRYKHFAAMALLLSLALSACGQRQAPVEPTPPPGDQSQPPAVSTPLPSDDADLTTTSPADPEGEKDNLPQEEPAMQMVVKYNGNTIAFELNDSQAARELYDQLPLTVEIEDFSTNEKIFYPPEGLDTSDAPWPPAGPGPWPTTPPGGMSSCFTTPSAAMAPSTSWAMRRRAGNGSRPCRGRSRFKKVMENQNEHRIYAALLAAVMALSLAACGSEPPTGLTPPAQTPVPALPEGEQPPEVVTITDIADGFVLIEGGTFEMGSPGDEPWRSRDETRHSITLSDFYISAYEVTQAEYESIMGTNPSSFSGDYLPVETVSWLDAINYCNTRSLAEGLTAAYAIDGQTVIWHREANGYRLPTEAEWEYACRAGTDTLFNTQTSISAEESNYYGHYPYEIEGNYFSQGNLETRPGVYRETAVAVGSFQANDWGLYDMHGNVGEWVWDWYGDYDATQNTDPTGPSTGTLRVNRGGGWNDFAKNMRSAYRATLPQDTAAFNVGIRLVRNAGAMPEAMVGSSVPNEGPLKSEAILIAYFSWGGNSQGIAEEIQSQTGADLFEIQLVTPYSSDYNTVLDQAQADQNAQARPELSTHVEDMDQYDTILLGYPNWWASIPMPIASFLEEYDFTGKTIIPFCSHGGGRFGQSLTAIPKLVPDASLGEALSIHYSGGSSLQEDISAWLTENSIPTN